MLQKPTTPTTTGQRNQRIMPAVKKFCQDYKKPLLIGSGMVLILTAMAIARKINSAGRKLIAAAKKYVGIREKSNNSGWDNTTFENKMKSAGWSNGAEWCNFFVKMLLLEISKGKAKEFFEKNISGSTQQTWKNLQTPSKYHEVLKTPCKGALILYQRVSDPSHGHIEIFVSKGKNGGYYVVSGNSDIGNGSQGVAYKERENGLDGCKILGYIKIKRLK